MTLSLLPSLLLAALTAMAVGGLYLAWPRPMDAEEWVLRRRQAAAVPAPREPRLVERLLTADAAVARRFRWALSPGLLT